MAYGDESPGTDRQPDEPAADGEDRYEHLVDDGGWLRNAVLLGLTLAAGTGLLAVFFPEPGPSGVGLFLLFAGVGGGLVEWAVAENGDG